jgi:hypothetical protein
MPKYIFPKYVFYILHMHIPKVKTRVNSSINNILNSKMIFSKKYENKVLKTIIIITSYNLNNFTLIWGYHSRLWNNNNFKFVKLIFLWINNYSFVHAKSNPMLENMPNATPPTPPPKYYSKFFFFSKLTWLTLIFSFLVFHFFKISFRASFGYSYESSSS